MAENTKIEWASHTFNPWEGCTKVSAGCKFCYAENRNARFGGGEAVNWGKGAPRRRTSEANWKLPIRWNREAKAFPYACKECGIRYKDPDLLGDPWNCSQCGGYLEWNRPRVFCASLADVFDDEVPAEWRFDLLELIRQTPNLDWLLLTKRPENVLRQLSTALESAQDEGSNNPQMLNLAVWLDEWFNGAPPANVWLGTSVENQDAADKRIPELLKVPARVRFLSCEPLLGLVNLNQSATCGIINPSGIRSYTRPLFHADIAEAKKTLGYRVEGGIHWCIAGGESGPNARPMHPDWARSLRDQCAAAGVPYLFKQWGEWRPPLEGEEYNTRGGRMSKPPAFIMSESGTVHCFQSENILNGKVVIRVGKKAAGRLLDGVEYNEFPEVD